MFVGVEKKIIQINPVRNNFIYLSAKEMFNDFNLIFFFYISDCWSLASKISFCFLSFLKYGCGFKELMTQILQVTVNLF